ncbi:retrovirus-related pol polyprotein from transposon TNT 1-94 [Tanacetum coccineum]
MQSASTGERNPLSQRHQEINMESTSYANDSRMNLPCADLIKGRGREYLDIGVPLYEASLKCDWKAANYILDEIKEMELVRYSITENGETALHIAASVKGPKHVGQFVYNLVHMMTKEDLELQNKNHNTALYLAAAAGNLEVVKILVRKNLALMLIPGGGSSDTHPSMIPLYAAALFGNHKVVKFLYDKSEGLRGDGWTFKNRCSLLEKCIETDMFGKNDIEVSEVEEYAFDFVIEDEILANIGEGDGHLHHNSFMEDKELEAHLIPRKGALDTQSNTSMEEIKRLVINLMALMDLISTSLKPPLGYIEVGFLQVLARGVQFSTGRAVWHEPEQFSSKLNNISLVSYTLTKWYQEPDYDKQRQKMRTAEGTTEGRKQNRNKSKLCKIGEIKYKRNIMCWNCNQKGRFQNQYSKLIASRGKEVNMKARYFYDALVCCIENTVEDHIMDSGASFHATYCKEELERFKLRSGKVRLADDKTLYIASVGDVILKTSFGTSWTLKDVRYISGVKRRLISVGQLDEEGYHVVWEVEESFFHNVSEDKESAKTAAGVSLKMVPETPLQFGVAERLSRTFRAERTGIHAEASIGLRIPEEEWRGKDTSLTHLKVFGCDSFVKVKDVYGEAMKCTFIGSGSDEMRYSFRYTKSHQVIQSRNITFVDSIYEARSVTDSSSLTKPIHESQVVLLDIPENLAENDNIVVEHGLSSEFTQSLSGSSNTSEGSKKSRSFEDSGRSDKEYSEDGASSKEGGFETPQIRRSTRESRALVRKEGMTEKAASACGCSGFKKIRMTEKATGAFLYSWNEEPCRDVHQVGDERVVEVLRSFNWPPSELITEDGVLPERGYSQFNDVSLGYLRVPDVQRYRKVRAVALLKGRQGDPLSPFLFLIVVESLQVAFIEACNRGIDKGVSLLDGGSNLSMLQFNLVKSNLLGVGVPQNEVDLVASSIKCSENTHFMYFRLSIGRNMHCCDGQSEVVDRFQVRLSFCKANFLSNWRSPHAR